MNPESISNGDLDWLAFQYVSGELTPAEAAAFEQTLAEDQAAREAVASVVQTADAVLALEPSHSAMICQSNPQRSTWRERARWMVAGAAAACVAIVACWEFASNQ